MRNYQKGETQTVQGGGIGVLGLLGVAFVVLKLTHVIDWSWWWVTAPFWGGFVLVIGLLVIGLLGTVAVAATIDGVRAIKQKKLNQERIANRLKQNIKVLEADTKMKDHNPLDGTPG
jgi:phosphoglycerol transferase MdoB-like AlkP superfamily enzyme